MVARITGNPVLSEKNVTLLESYNVRGRFTDMYTQVRKEHSETICVHVLGVPTCYTLGNKKAREGKHSLKKIDGRLGEWKIDQMEDVLEHRQGGAKCCAEALM